ncbi:LacI family DNA-binding transcriptional regulator [Leifsonia kafniensis]|uniref:LacI family DNA-binding transcriptional regulator n=1 Tax=Leifsonia kafniensis TaxID=475957 RepID=A0ABP7KLL2_9MICO
MSVNVRDVAALAAVSVGTVSNVMNHPDKVSPITVARVQDAIKSLGFVRNDAARQLRAGHSTSLGLVVLDAANPFFAELARGAENRAMEEGFTVLVGNSDEKPEREALYLDLFEEQRVHGVLIAPFGDAIPRLEQLKARGTPAVLVDRGVDHPGFSSVSVDDEAGGYLAAEHLLSIGRRRLAFVGGSMQLRQVVDRLAGAQRAVAEVAGASLEVIETDSLTVRAGREAGDDIRNRAAADRPDAIFAANDLLAMGLLQALMKNATVSVPGDIALIGYDDIAFAEAAVVPLSSIRQPSELIGYTAVQLLLREAEDGADFVHEQVLFQPELIVRESTGGRAS